MATDNDTTIIKFFLHLSKGEQKKRFLERLNNPEKNWKFSSADIEERQYWDKYQKAYEDMLNATSTKEAPWYIIPADNKWYARAVISEIIAERIEELKLSPPQLSDSEAKKIAAARKRLENE